MRAFDQAGTGWPEPVFVCLVLACRRSDKRKKQGRGEGNLEMCNGAMCARGLCACVCVCVCV